MSFHNRTSEVLPDSLKVEVKGPVMVVTLSRPQKRNALDDSTVEGLERIFSTVDREVRSALIVAEGAHFCAGLDLNEMGSHDAFSGIAHSRSWHRAMQAIESGAVPVVASLKGAVIGGGLELAAACHLRVADPTSFFALPEGQRGLFVGGGGAVRIPRLMGVSRMADLMLTGRRLDAREAYSFGLVQYLSEEGDADSEAWELATTIAGNAPQTNFAVLQALPRIAQANPDEGYLLEALMASIAQSTDDAKQRMSDFLAGRTNTAGEK